MDSIGDVLSNSTSICHETSNLAIYDSVIDLSSLKVKSSMQQQLVLWLIVLIPMVLISVFLSCVLGKLSDKLFCVPMINKENAKFDENKLSNAKGFKGFSVKLGALVKAVSLSGIIITMVITYAIMSKYEACEGYDETFVVIVLSWIACFFAYIFVWKISFSYAVVKLSIFKKLLWFILSKVITLIIGLSFVRVVYLHDYGTDSYCYCNNDLLLSANLFTVVYIAIFPVIWIFTALKLHKLLWICLTSIFTGCCLCQCSLCCCEIKMKQTERLPPFGAACITCCNNCCAKLLLFIPNLIFAILFIIAPLICLYMRFQIVADKWSNYVKAMDNLDVTDIVFIWILFTVFTFFIIEGLLRCKRKYCGGKKNKDESQNKETKEGTETSVTLKTKDEK